MGFLFFFSLFGIVCGLVTSMNFMIRVMAWTARMGDGDSDGV